MYLHIAEFLYKRA